MVILGDSHIGKTSLVTRFAEGYYRENSRPATIGAHFKTKRITSSNNTPTKIQIWDTAGAKEFHAMAPMFYKNAAAIIVCYDVTCRQSFEGMRIWLDEVRRKVKVDDEVVVAIAALKTDLLQDGTNNNRIEPAVPEYEVEQLAEALGVIYLPTSAKTDMNVNALFQCVSDRVLQHRYSNNNNNMNTSFGGGAYGSNNNNILINRDDLNSAPIPSTQPRTRDQYDKYYKKNSETSQESSQMNTHDESTNSMANSRVRTNSGSGTGNQFSMSNDSAPGRVPTPNSDGTTSINVGDDHHSIVASPSPGKKRRGKYDKDTSPNKNKGKDKGLCPGGECADENLYACSPMTCGVGSTGDGSSSGCIVQ